METTGTLKQIISNPYKDKKDGSDKEIVNIIVEVIDGEFTNFLAFDIWKEELRAKCRAIAIGSKVEVKWHPRSNESNGRWFSKFSAWSVEAIPDSASNIPQVPASNQAGGAAVTNTTQVADNQDGLPF